MDRRTIQDEVDERLELRGVTLYDRITSPAAEAEACFVAVEVIEDELIRRGLDPDTGLPVR